MRTQFRKAVIPDEIRSLVLFDHKAFHEYPADWFDRDTWRACEAWWLIVDGRKVGCCAFALHQNFEEDVREDCENPRVRDSLYIVTTGILPRFRGQALGSLMKCWQIAYARHHGFTRMVTNTRKSNQAMIALNKKFGFQVLRTTPDYYDNPREPTVVMERVLDRVSFM